MNQKKVWHQTVEELRKVYPKVGVERLCGLFGKTRHAYYDKLWFSNKRESEQMMVLEMVKMMRREMPKLGTRKLMFLLQPFMETHSIKMGRDALHGLLQDHNLIIQNKKRYARTTNSNHWYRKYPNLINGLCVEESERLWVSDITYISIAGGFSYLSLITDAYSKKIVGHCLYKTLESIGCVIALEMALRNREKDTSLIHHSDRGIQYCCHDYVNILNKESVKISMTESGSPYDNAIAERVNGILKTEFGLDKTFN
ncbi:IS3 family transposase [Carboxylicivirga sp. N1Y132]|uniref:IS3 family transposase n=1 Tax=Carboxylicivirga marina TaxID=2800988 RepID=A0ABS1HJI1_9BACT|nr:IS3 family transposase [Carboxylicivirga marina]